MSVSHGSGEAVEGIAPVTLHLGDVGALVDSTLRHQGVPMDTVLKLVGVLRPPTREAKIKLAFIQLCYVILRLTEKKVAEPRLYNRAAIGQWAETVLAAGIPIEFGATIEGACIFVRPSNEALFAVWVFADETKDPFVTAEGTAAGLSSLSVLTLAWRREGDANSDDAFTITELIGG